MLKLKLCVLLVGGSLMVGCGGDEPEASVETAMSSDSRAVDQQMDLADEESEEWAPPPLPDGSIPKMAKAEEPMKEASIPAASPEQIETDLHDLNSAVDQYIADQKRAPSVRALISMGYVEKLPTPPVGKSYYFDKKQNRFILRNG